MNDTYSKEELSKIVGTAPTKGLWCKKCNVFIPQFADVTKSEMNRVRHLIDTGRSAQATLELKYFASCPIDWAKLWVQHRGVPEPIFGYPCPYCAKPLRTSEAKQCIHCKRDWHVENRILLLGTDTPWAAELP